MCLFGISSVIGTTSSVDAKLWAMQNGPKICSLNLPAVEIEVDAKVAVKWVSGRMCNNYAHCSPYPHFVLQATDETDPKED